MKHETLKAEIALRQAAMEFAHAHRHAPSCRYNAAIDDLHEAAIEYAKVVEKEKEKPCKQTTS